MPRELIVEYLDGGRGFAALARTVSTLEMDRSPISGQWSPAFIIHHLSDAELHFATRFLRILTEDKPAIQPFDEDVYPSRLNYSQRDPQLSLRSFEAVNKTMADLLLANPRSRLGTSRSARRARGISINRRCQNLAQPCSGPY